MNNIIIIRNGEKSMHYQIVTRPKDDTFLKIASYLSTAEHLTDTISDELYSLTGIKIVKLNVLAEYNL